MKDIKIAILDDYQQASSTFGDWSVIRQDAEVTVFSEYIGDEKTLSEALKPFSIVCIMRERTLITAGLLGSLPNLKLIVSTGPRNAAIDLEAVKAHGIELANTGYVGSGAPELTWALIMAAGRGIVNENQSLRNGGWQIGVGSDLSGKTLGIVGLGNIGRKIAQIGQVFDMRVIAWSDSLTAEEAARYGVTYVSKADLFRESDFLTVHLVLSERSRGVISDKELSLMKPGAFLINTSRGPLINEEALVKVLSEGRIAGAALDVFDTEPLPAGHPFRTMDNVLATPHIGYVTNDTYKVFFDDTVAAIEAWLKKQVK
ncbi:D-2-hydroxyacid dehydrogenase family protein [Mucilaginibacter celer]|uniref:D-2-hydroxyacid dehydrogenase family protein n=1 Tax=Mucilaginibacter celer TaxID=2305508 RepID=A0A494VMN6_9SPHI|nr:D-2-hydroxyacid dehydrogenase family protein [Mucilaginibacter celer]AYL94220.1 D-2-hydroxyacid dehydrogenase family protein [Mucilaginibacter celer]